MARQDYHPCFKDEETQVQGLAQDRCWFRTELGLEPVFFSWAFAVHPPTGRQRKKTLPCVPGFPFYPGAGVLERCPSPTRVPRRLGNLGGFQAHIQGSRVGLAARLTERLTEMLRTTPAALVTVPDSVICKRDWVSGIQVVSLTLVPLPGPKRKRLKHVCVI